MKTLLATLVWIARDFGPLVAFWVANRFLGFVPALALSMAWALVDVVLLKARKKEISAFLKFSIGVTILFGGVDIWMRGPFLVRYEAVMTNVATGVFFAMTLRRDRTIIQEFAERRATAKGTAIPITPDTLQYFRLCTWTWTIYFFVKAVFYAWTGWRYGLARAFAIRVVVGNATFYGLLFVSIFLARPIILALRRLKLAPSTSV